MPGKSIPHIRWLELLSFDKFVHAGVFFVLQLLYMRGFLLQEKFLFLQRHYIILPLLLCVAYGGALELMQAYCFSERSGDVLDFIANTFGCICGALLFGRMRKLLRVYK